MTGKILDPENPLFGATFCSSISCISRLLAIFPLKFPIFVAMATGVGMV